MNKLEKIDQQEQRAREQIAALQALLKEIGDKRTEQENLQIIQQFRALRLSRDELYAFLDGGGLPPALIGALQTAAPEPETIYTRRERTRRNERETNNETPITESEGKNDEE